MSDSFARARRFFKQAVTERLGLKLTSLVITVLLLVLVRFQEKSERFFDVELVPLLPEPSSGLVMTSGFPKTVRVQLAGSSSIINSLTPREIPAVEVDLTSQKVGTSNYYFNDNRFEESLKRRSNKMHFVSVERTIPESIQIRMERLVSRRLPVTVRTVGKLPLGMEIVESPTTRPTEVNVVGPASQMRDMKTVETDDIILDGMTVGDQVQIVAAVPQAGVTIQNSEDIEVSLKIRYIPGERVFPEVPVEVKNTEMNADVKPAMVSVSLSGPKIILDAMTVDQVRPTVILEAERAASPSTFPADVALSSLPDDVRVTALEPPTVLVTLTHSAATKAKKKESTSN